MFGEQFRRISVLVLVAGMVDIIYRIIWTRIQPQTHMTLPPELKASRRPIGVVLIAYKNLKWKWIQIRHTMAYVLIAIIRINGLSSEIKHFQ